MDKNIFSCLGIFIVLLYSLILSSPARGAEPTLFLNSTVVILIGLPGDLDSETIYMSEATLLLQQLNRIEIRPKQVLLFSNLTSFVPPPVDYSLQTFANKRASFLGLPDQIKVNNANSVFIIFGHAGLQGADPVFHVPGPRIKPDDLVQIATATETSTWFLFFRGSGLFAKVLNRPDRTILATESEDKTFSQDPISFPLFLDALKQSHDREMLERIWADKTRRWYLDRHLARTEEPALWLAGNPAQKLIGPTEDLKPDPSTSPADSPTPPTALPVSSNQSSPNATWKDLPLVDPDTYPENDAVILSRHEDDLFGDDRQQSEDSDEYIQILKPSGKRWGNFDFTFSPPAEDLQFLACEVKTPNGKITSLDPEDIRDAEASSLEGYDPKHRKIFSLPHVQPGAVLHVHTKRSWKRSPLPHVFEEVSLTDTIPTRTLDIEIRIPKRAAFHSKVLYYPTSEPTMTETDYGSIYRWNFQNLPAFLPEPLSPQNHEPELVATSFPDWHDFLTWYVETIRDVDQPSAEMAAKVQELIHGAKTDREKIAAVTRLVTGFRYVSVPLGINSFRPHAATHVWENRYGDCKDKANLLNTLLGTLGYKTNLVLVPRFSQAYQELPGFAFNHAISVVHLNNDTLWIDSTDDVCPFGLLPPGDPGRNVLIVQKDSGDLTTLPQPFASDHRYEIKSEVHLPGPDDRTASVEIEVSTKGYADYSLRSAQKDLETRAKNLALLQETFSPTNGHFAPTEQSATSADDLNVPFAWKAQGTWPGLISQIPASQKRIFFLPTWLPRQWETAVLPRHNDLFLNDGYPMTVQQSWTLHLPAGSFNVEIPPSLDHTDSVLSWKLNWSKHSEHEIGVQLQLTLHQASLGQPEVAMFQKSCNLLEEELRDGLSYQP